MLKTRVRDIYTRKRGGGKSSCSTSEDESDFALVWREQRESRDTDIPPSHSRAENRLPSSLKRCGTVKLVSEKSSQKARQAMRRIFLPRPRETTTGPTSSKNPGKTRRRIVGTVHQRLRRSVDKKVAMLPGFCAKSDATNTGVSSFHPAVQ